jgi:hypothetical protein
MPTEGKLVVGDVNGDFDIMAKGMKVTGKGLGKN